MDGPLNAFGKNWSSASDSGSILVSAGRNITFNSNTFVDVGAGTGTVTVAAGGNLTMTSAQPNEIFTAGGAITLSTGAAATMTLGTSVATAVLSNGGNISLTADNLNINQGVSATNTGNVLIQPVTAGQLISLGTATGGLTLTSTELNLVTAKNLTIGNANAGAVTLGGTVKPTNVTNLTITTGRQFYGDIRLGTRCHRRHGIEARLRMRMHDGMLAGSFYLYLDIAALQFELGNVLFD